MKAQELFDSVVNGLRLQGSRCVNLDYRCLYRFQVGEKTLKCAAGLLLPDDKYNPEMEGKIITELPIFESIVGVENIQLLDSLQKAHDAANDMPGVEQKFKLIAERYCLTYTPVAA